MEKISNCIICHSSKKFLRFDCNHEICVDCIYMQILTNFQELKSLKEIDQDVTYKCIKCEIGKFSISNINLSHFIRSKNNITTESEICNTHKKIFKLLCKTCSRKLCLLCYDEHDFGHDILDLKYYQSNIGNHCEEHKDKLSLYCKTCNITICNLCYELQHHNHNTVITNDYFKIIKKDLNLVRMPYNIKTIESFIEKFTHEENLFIKQMTSDYEEIKMNISELVVYLNDISHSVQLKFEKLEMDFRFNCELVKKVFTYYYQDINKIIELDYLKLEFLNKLPKVFGDFKFRSNTNKQVFNDIFSSLKKNLSQLKEDSKLISYKIDDTISIKCIQTFEAHTGWVLSLLQLQNGFVVSGSGDKSIKLWDPTQNFKCIQTLEEHGHLIWSLIQLNNGLMVSGSADKCIKIWDTAQNFKCIQTLEEDTNSVRCLLQLENGLMISGSDKNIKIWDPNQNFKCIQTLEGNGNVIWCLHKLQNGLMASGSGDRCIKIWDIAQNFKCIQTLDGHSDTVRCLLQLNNGLTISGSQDKSIKIWDTAMNFKCVMTLEGHNHWVYSLLQLHNGLMVSGGGDNCIKLWDPSQNFLCIQTLEEHTSGVYPLIRLDSGLLISGSQDKHIKIWK